MAKWTADEIPDQDGRVAVVTGANSGLGLVTARELAGAGATVIVAARDGKATVPRRRSPPAPPTPRSSRADSISPTSTRCGLRRAGSIAEHPRIDVLINNAGVMMPPRSTTADGFELQFGTNHLGHFALTGLLLDALSPAAGRAW